MKELRTRVVATRHVAIEMKEGRLQLELAGENNTGQSYVGHRKEGTIYQSTLSSIKNKSPPYKRAQEPQNENT